MRKEKASVCDFSEYFGCGKCFAIEMCRYSNKYCNGNFRWINIIKARRLVYKNKHGWKTKFGGNSQW